ncbi:uncharacterized protein LOC143293886 isoform X2 [Babylonia areolata]|uniref:uncharacterized protein LOC143293886 isoform X2 n=1 Tax=Babylonia areolata TaxID=304850 RepID=UPI003FD4ED46
MDMHHSSPTVSGFCVPYDAVPTLQEQCRKYGGRLSSVENRFMYAWTNKEPPQPLPVPEGLTLTTLKPTDAAALCERWKHYRPDPDLDQYMQEVATCFASSAIVNEKGELMAYIAMQFNGSMAMLHVEPQHRGKGLGQIVLVDLTRKLLASQHTAFGFIPTKDTSFLATSSQKLGFSWVPQGSFAWVRYQPKASSSPLPSAAGPVANQTAASASSAASFGKGDCSQEEEGGGLFLTALPLSCNECSDISNDVNSSCEHIGMGIS